MKAESAFWQKVRPVFQAAKLDPVRVENPIGPGTPDVNTTRFWMELKSIAAWPAKDGNIVQIKHYTPQQRVWLLRRWKYAPHSTFLLLEVRASREVLLFDGDVAARVVGKAPHPEHHFAARRVISTCDLHLLPEIIHMAQAS